MVWKWVGKTSGEVPADFPLSAVQQVFEDVETVEEVVSVEEQVQQEDLHHHVGQVEHFDEHVQKGHVRTPTPAKAEGGAIGDLERKILKNHKVKGQRENLALQFQGVLHVT